MAALSLARAGLSQNEQTLPWSDLPPPLPSSGTGVPFTDLATIKGFTVPNDQFFVLHHGGVARLERDLELRIEREVTLSFDEIKRCRRKRSAFASNAPTTRAWEAMALSERSLGRYAARHRSPRAWCLER
jgi:hypothetical protein